MPTIKQVNTFLHIPLMKKIFFLITICTNFTLQTFAQINIAATLVKKNTSCHLPCGNGAFYVQVNNGNAPFQYTITPSCSATMLLQDTFQYVKNGTYTIVVNDALNNTASCTIVVPNYDSIQLNLQYTQPTQTLGTASVAPVGGTPPYFYLWYPGSLTTASVAALAPATYSVNIVDANGCSAGANFILSYPLAINNSNLQNNNLQCVWQSHLQQLLFENNLSFSSVSIISIQGKIVYHSIVEKNQKSILLPNLTPGLYFCKTNSNQTSSFLVP